MSDLKKIVGINLLILVIYSLLIHFTSSGGEEELVILVLSAFAVGGHVAITVIVALVYFFSRNAPMGKAFLLSALVVLVVGFSACLGSAAMT
jgi:hypothetical protein